MGFKLDPIIRKTYSNEGELDQVENTRNFAQNQLLPQLQMVVQELKTKFGTWEFLGAILIVFLSGDINLDYDDLLLVCLSAQLPRFEVFIKKSMVTVVVSYNR
jgi:hypothetical protein